MKVAIDGPAGSGKSTVAHALAERYDLTLLDTGAMYRAVTLVCLERGVSAADADAVTEVAHSIRITFGTAQDGTQTVQVDGKDVTQAIRTEKVDANVSAVAAIPAVREAMVAQQRLLGIEGDVVAEGRDIGTVVFPDAEVKIFLTADASARAHRRAVQRSGGDAAKDADAKADVDEEKHILEELQRRDEADSQREADPLRAAEDALRVDSSNLTLEEVVDMISQRIDDVKVSSKSQAGLEVEDTQGLTESKGNAKIEPMNEAEATKALAADPIENAEAQDKPAPAAKPAAKPAASKKREKKDEVKQGRLHVFGHNTLDDYYDHPIREFPITSRALLAASIGACAIFTKILWPWKLENGKAMWDAPEGQVVVMNHVSMLDPIVLVVTNYAHGRRIRPIYKSEFDKHRFVTWFFARIGAIPVVRGTADMKAIRRTQHALQRGEDVLVFPEGTRIHSDDQEVEMHGGFALIAQLAKAPVLPVAIVGARDGTPGGNKPLRPHRVFMRAGEKVTFAMLNIKGRKQQAKAMEDLVVQRMYELRDALRAEHPGKM